MKKIFLSFLLLSCSSVFALSTFTIESHDINIKDFDFSNDTKLCGNHIANTSCFLLRVNVDKNGAHSYLRHVDGPGDQYVGLNSCTLDIVLSPSVEVINNAKKTGTLAIPKLSVELDGESAITFRRFYDSIMAFSDIYMDYNVEDFMDNDLVQYPNLGGTNFLCESLIDIKTISSILTSTQETEEKSKYINTVLEEMDFKL
jgi:hypothetical protein